MNLPAYTIGYSDESVEDLKAIVQHYTEISPAIVYRFQDALLKAEADMLRNPFAFSKVGYKDFRRIIIKRFPYKMTFRIEKNSIQVFCVIHFSRSNKYIKRRLKK